MYSCNQKNKKIDANQSESRVGQTHNGVLSVHAWNAKSTSRRKPSQGDLFEHEGVVCFNRYIICGMMKRILARVGQQQNHGGGIQQSVCYQPFGSQRTLSTLYKIDYTPIKWTKYVLFWV